MQDPQAHPQNIISKREIIKYNNKKQLLIIIIGTLHVCNL